MFLLQTAEDKKTENYFPDALFPVRRDFRMLFEAYDPEDLFIATRQNLSHHERISEKQNRDRTCQARSRKLF